MYLKAKAKLLWRRILKVLGDTAYKPPKNQTLDTVTNRCRNSEATHSDESVTGDVLQLLKSVDLWQLVLNVQFVLLVNDRLEAEMSHFVAHPVDRD